MVGITRSKVICFSCVCWVFDCFFVLFYVLFWFIICWTATQTFLPSKKIKKTQQLATADTGDNRLNLGNHHSVSKISGANQFDWSGLHSETCSGSWQSWIGIRQSSCASRPQKIRPPKVSRSWKNPHVIINDDAQLTVVLTRISAANGESVIESWVEFGGPSTQWISLIATARRTQNLIRHCPTHLGKCELQLCRRSVCKLATKLNCPCFRWKHRRLYAQVIHLHQLPVVGIPNLWSLPNWTKVEAVSSRSHRIVPCMWCASGLGRNTAL